MPEIHCRHFNGYKPCGLGTDCSPQCPSFSRVSERVLIVHLEALGAVLRSTALLTAIRRKFPKSHITWVTKAPAHRLLENLGIERVLTTSEEDLLKLKALSFDSVYCIDKSLLSSAIASSVKTHDYKGFRADSHLGAIVPANPEARELWELGLDNNKKFFVNQKSELELVHGALALGEYRRDPYLVKLTLEETRLSYNRRMEWIRHGRHTMSGLPIVIGLNTGCSGVIPYKKLSVEGHRKLIALIQRTRGLENAAVVLLGGPEDTEANLKIAEGNSNVIQSPTTKGLRDGLCSVAACDVVVTGDSLGMHMAIGLRKWTVAWFGPTCAQEIDLFDFGVKVQAKVPCSPCWKRVCHNQVMCYDQVDFGSIVQGIQKGIAWHTSYSRQPSQEISF